MIQQISHALKPIFRTQTYRDLFYVIVWSGIWCAGGLVILAGFDYSMSSDYFVTAILLCVWLLLTYTLILILTSVERLLEYVGGQNHDKSEIPNEQTIVAFGTDNTLRAGTYPPSVSKDFQTLL